MDPAIFQFYLKRLPAEYAPIGSQLPPFEKVLDDLEHLHGRQRVRDMGLVFLAQELLTYLLDGRVLPLATDGWRIDPDSSPLFPRITDAQGQEIITVMSSRPAEEVTAIARLIAAAPRLLRACQEVLDEHEQPGTHTWAPAQVAYCDVCDGARSAITLAITGQDDRPESYDATAEAAEARLRRAAPELLRACRLVLTRLDLEAAEHPGAIFPAAALRGDLRTAIAQATGEKITPPTTEVLP